MIRNIDHKTHGSYHIVYLEIPVVKEISDDVIVDLGERSFGDLDMGSEGERSFLP